MKSCVFASVLIHLNVKRNKSGYIKRKLKKCCWDQLDQNSRNIVKEIFLET